MQKNTHISIIGGGIGGLTTALCLSHQGFHNYTIYERAAEFKEIGAAISLWPNALHVYKEIGIYESLQEKWGEIGSAFLKTDKGKVISKTSPDYGLPLVCIHRAHLHSTLLEGISKEKLVPKHRLLNVELGAARSTLHFENGTRIETDLVIGADGINSALRQQLKNDGKPVFRGYNIWRGIATLADTPVGYSSETWGKGSRVGIVPISAEKFGWWATLNEEEGQGDEPQGTLAKLKQHFGNWHDPIPQLFENSPEIIKNKIGDRPSSPGWHRQNAVLLGDAAHPTTPNLGQGACMAIEGAYLLAKCLAHFPDHQSAFARYEALHYKRSSDVTKQSLQNGKMGQLENGLAIKARNTMLKSMPEKLVMRMIDKFFSYNVTTIDIT